jgi:hypothetical protein
MTRWYAIPIEDLPPEHYLERAARLHEVAKQLEPAIGLRFEAMALDAFEIAERKSLAGRQFRTRSRHEVAA